MTITKIGIIPINSKVSSVNSKSIIQRCLRDVCMHRLEHFQYAALAEPELYLRHGSTHYFKRFPKDSALLFKRSISISDILARLRFSAIFSRILRFSVLI